MYIILILYVADPLLPPRVVVTTTSEIVLTTNNYNLTLECAGIPNNSMLSYAWEKRSSNHNHPLRMMQGAHFPYLTINNLRPEDTGYYRCTASNSTGAIESQYKKIIITGVYILSYSLLIYYIYVHMFVAGLPVVTMQPSPITVNVSNDVIMKCTVKGYGSVSVMWNKVNSTLPSSIIKEIKSVNEITSDLSISNVTTGHKGYYYCIANNSVGTVNSTMAYLNVSSE